MSLYLKLKISLLVISSLLIFVFTVPQLGKVGDMRSDAVETKPKYEKFAKFSHFNPTDDSVVDHTGKGRDVTVNYTSLKYHNDGQNGVNILIIAAMRTGSSFTGEIFGQRGDVFYLFEPGQSYDFYFRATKLSHNFLTPLYLKLLRKILTCGFSSSKIFVDALSKQIEKGNILKYAPALLTSSLCEGKDSRCRTSFPASEVTKICKSLPHRAIKSIRIHDINLVTRLMEQDEGNLKVIHLVRDPRAMVSSRLLVTSRLKNGQLLNVSHITENKVLMKITVQYCEKWSSNIEVGSYIPWIRSHYKMVRYEDMARYPLKYTSEVYEFVGLGKNIPDRVFNWIQRNTKVQHPSRATYSTSRNSNETYDAWRYRMTFQLVDYIQSIEECKKMMEMSGYSEIPNEKALTDSQQTFVTSVPELDSHSYDQIWRDA